MTQCLEFALLKVETFLKFVFLIFNMGLLLSFYWICYNIASVLVFLATRHVGS